MGTTAIIIIAIIVVLLIIAILYFISTQRSLVKLDENINNAMSQIGVQLNSRWDALTALSDLARQFASHETEVFMESIKLRRQLTPTSTAADVQAQETALKSAVGSINAVAEAYPELKSNEVYLKTMDSVNKYEDTVRVSRMVYNDSVTKLNRACRMFPSSIVASMLHFEIREYLEVPAGKTEMPSMH
ncbi:MAG: LemA family protein [Eubacteriales bacterium]|nr:LemA family protein [Eubacteriales bacterium]MDY4898750.1 LemA family protein [Eubacteriales bacterium]